MNADTLRLALTVYLVAMFLLALLYLRRHPLTWIQFAAWGLFALLVPALGPFLVIVAQPGKTKRMWSDGDVSALIRVYTCPCGRCKGPRPIPRKRSDILRIRRKR